MVAAYKTDQELIAQLDAAIESQSHPREKKSIFGWITDRETPLNHWYRTYRAMDAAQAEAWARIADYRDSKWTRSAWINSSRYNAATLNSQAWQAVAVEMAASIPGNVLSRADLQRLMQVRRQEVLSDYVKNGWQPPDAIQGVPDLVAPRYPVLMVPASDLWRQEAVEPAPIHPSGEKAQRIPIEDDFYRQVVVPALAEAKIDALGHPVG